MARPIKQGLDYFPLDVDIEQDDKIETIEAEHGHIGFSVVIRLMAKVYKEGYFYDWPEKKAKVFARKINLDIDHLQAIVSDCVNEGIFNKALFDKYGILTSRGIQSRYLEAVKRRKQVVFHKQYFLVDDVMGIIGSNKIAVFIEDEDGTRVNVNINDDSTHINATATPKKAIPKTKMDPKTKLVKFTAEDMEHAQLLFQLMQQGNPNVKKPNFDKWADEFRLMRERDLRDEKATRYLIKWSQAHSFWRGNILSPSKLREQWDRLFIQAQEEHTKKQNQLAIGQNNQKTGDIFGGVTV